MNGGHKISSSGLSIVVFRVLILELQDDSSYIMFGCPCKGMEAFFFLFLAGFVATLNPKRCTLKPTRKRTLKPPALAAC